MKSLDRGGAEYQKYVNEKSAGRIAKLAVSSETITGSPKRFYRNKGESPALAAVFDSKANSINSNASCGGQPIRFSMQKHKKKEGS